MIPITAGMTPTQFNAAMNSNVADLGLTGKPIDFTALQKGHEVQTAFAHNLLGTFTGTSSTDYINFINSAFGNVSLANKVIVGAVDVKTFGATGDGVTDDSANIQTAVNAGNIIIQNGVFLMGDSLKIPSNRTVYLFNCKIKKADASYDNFFRNSDMVNGNVNIKVLGLGAVEFDGNAVNNNDGYVTYGPKNDYPIHGVPGGEFAYRYIGFIFHKVDGFEIAGLSIDNYSHWFGYLQRSCNGSVHDIYIDCSFLTTPSNQDFVALSYNAYNVEFYNIASTTADDFSNLGVAHYSDLAFTGIANWNVGDVHDLYYHDIHIYSTPAHSISWITGDGGKIYNITYKDIVSDYANMPFGTCYFGYYDVAPAVGDTYNILMDNITFNAAGTVVFNFCEGVTDFTAKNIINKTGLATYRNWGGDLTHNVTINGVQLT
jgi:hypothetical protein